MIYIKMLEPTTASIAVYLITTGTIRINKHKRLMEKNPFYMKKKVCKWFLLNKDELMNSVIDESNDFIMDTINYVHLKYYNPSLFMIIYILIIILVILF